MTKAELVEEVSTDTGISKNHTAIIVDGLLIRRALRKLAAERLPGVSTNGMTMYAVMRALQIRRWRMPAPRLKPGDEV